MDQNRGNSGKLWDQLKSLGYGKTSDSAGIVLEEEGVKVFESHKVADVFNRFYTSVASSLVSKLPNPIGLYSIASLHFRSIYSRLRTRDPFVISPVSRQFIRQQLTTLNPKKAVGLDGISSKFLRDGTAAIVEPVAHMIN